VKGSFGLAPDFKTIAGFRKDNGKAIRSVCRQLVVLCRNLNLFSAMRVRRQTVEQPYGPLKYWLGATHFMSKSLPRVSTQMSLHVLAYFWRVDLSVHGYLLSVGSFTRCGLNASSKAVAG